MRRSRSRSMAAVLLTAGLCLVPAPAGAAVACEEVRVPVSVAGTSQSMAGTLCAHAGAALAASEAPFFPASARLRAFVLHGYGHSVNYAPNAPDYHREVVDWTRALGA